MIWSGLCSPLQHVLYIQELKGRKNHVLIQPSWKKDAAASEMGWLGFSPQTGWTGGQRHIPPYGWWRGEMRKTFYFTCLVVVLELCHISSTGLCYPLACHQVAHYHRSRTNFCPPQPQSFTTQHTWVKLELTPAGVIKLQWDVNSFSSWFYTWSSQATWLFLSWLGQVGHTCVWTHEDIARVQSTFQEALFGLRYMNASQGSLWKRVSRNQSQTVHTNLVNAVYGLERWRGRQAKKQKKWAHQPGPKYLFEYYKLKLSLEVKCHFFPSKISSIQQWPES